MKPKELTKPRRYQERGIRQMQKFGGRVLLADDPGLGKTIQTLIWKTRYLRGGTVVVVCPAIAKYTWEEQAREHVRTESTVLSGRKGRRLLGRKGHFYIINYDILGDPRLKKGDTWVRMLKKIKPALVVIDECHAIKDVETIRYKACKFLCTNTRHLIAISGTPATNYPYELWPTLNLLRPDKFKSRWEFGHRFCGPRKTPFGNGWEFKGSTNSARLNSILKKTCMIRRRKEDVLKDLPAKIRTVIPVDIADRKGYLAAEKDLIKWLIQCKKRSRAFRAVGNEKLLRVGYLRRLAAESKMAAVVEWIKTFLKENPDRKLIVFGIHHAGVLDVLTEKFPGIAVRIDGKTSDRKKRMYQDAFNNDKKFRLLFGNIDSAGTAWSCRSASDILFCELPWVPGKVTQAEDRIHGIKRGMKGRRANIWFIVAKDTIEERIVRILHNKQRNLGRVMDGGRAAKFEVLGKLEESLLKRAA